MGIVTEISWEQVADPAFTPLTRQAFRTAVTTVADRARAAMPASHSRIDKAEALVLAGDVELLEGGTARVASQCQGATQYRVVNGTCDCKDFPQAPDGWCKHRLSAAIARRVQELPPTQTGKELAVRHQVAPARGAPSHVSFSPPSTAKSSCSSPACSPWPTPRASPVFDGRAGLGHSGAGARQSYSDVCRWTCVHGSRRCHPGQRQRRA